MKSREARAALLFLAPAIVLLSLFFFAPVIAGFALSVTDFDLYTLGDVHNLRFIALRNYRELLANPIFWTAFVNTLYFALVGGPLTVAVSLDAAGQWGQFRHVTLPMLGPTFLFVGVVVAIGQLQIFAEPYVMTGGGPLNKTLTIVMMMYQQGFKFWRMGYAAAVAFILFLVIGAATLLQMRMGEKR